MFAILVEAIHDDGNERISAAAVMLAAAGVREPNRIKTRLIVTADWDATYGDFVSGGYLNMKRAAWLPSKSGLATQSEPDVWRLIDDLNTPTVNDRIKVEEGTCRRTNVNPCVVPKEVQFERVLRIRRIAGDENRFRVWFVDPEFNHLIGLDGVPAEREFAIQRKPGMERRTKEVNRPEYGCGFPRCRTDPRLCDGRTANPAKYQILKRN